MGFYFHAELPDYILSNSAFGVILLIFRDNRHAIPNAASIIPIPASILYPTGTVNVHFTIPKSFKNTATIGLIIKLHTVTPTTVERTTAGMKESAVCKINCPVVKPRDFRIP